MSTSSAKTTKKKTTNKKSTSSKKPSKRSQSSGKTPKKQSQTALEYPLLPLRDVVIFPGMVIPLFIGRPRSVSALEAGMQGKKQIVLVAQKNMDIDDPEVDDLYAVGTQINILQLLKLPDGSTKVLIEGVSRVRIKNVLIDDPFFVAEVQTLPDKDETSVESKALLRHVNELFENYVKLNRKVPQETLLSIMNQEDPGRLSDSIAAHLSVKVSDKQRLLSTASPTLRLRTLIEILGQEIEILELEHKIKGEVRKNMEQSQKEYYLHEQIKAIQRELGKEGGEGSEDWSKYEKKIKRAKMSREAEDKAFEELERLVNMPPMSPEAAVVRNYLDWLCDLPWSKSTKDILDVIKAEKILDEDHYGLEKAKERILEYLAVRKLKQSQKGPIICFVGPPGVGKTSLGRSIARCMNRKFVRIALGGVRDEAEIRGHRRTYIGSMPGRIIQSLKKAKSNNPVFLLDEIDKMSMDFRGDPSSALLEVLDPEQNHTFSDHYLEVEFDLSKIMFIATANVTHTIPSALYDRMEIIEIPSYTDEDKFHIAKEFIIPKQIQNHGLNRYTPKFNKDSILRVIRDYTREAGVRNMERELASVCRKLARKATTETLKRGTQVTPKMVNDLLGVPKYREEPYGRDNGIGCCTGLAVTSCGGEILPIEVTIMPGTGKLTLTGKLGDVMQESAKAALSFARTRSRELNLERDFYKTFDIHIHVPEGAIPKDGPSAGISIATALISALTGVPVLEKIAMTGEITLRGKVLPVGGVKEKVLAAHRNEFPLVLLPEANRKDLPDIPEHVTSEVEIRFVSDMQEVLNVAFETNQALKKVS